MSEITSLNQYLQNRTYTTGIHNRSWRQFALDHRDEIKQTANIEVIDKNAMSQVKYNIARFLRSRSYMYAIPYAWIIPYINYNLPSEIDFKDEFILYIPDENYMERLWEVYRSSL